MRAHTPPELKRALIAAIEGSSDAERLENGYAQGPGLIQAAIDDKACHLGVYRESGDSEQWLLVVGSTGAGSSLDVEHARGAFVSPFDRTLFLELFSRRCIELTTHVPKF